MGCDPEDGLLIPSLGPDHHCNAGAVILYLALLMWCFLGVALIADLFMAAIETITSRETSVMASVFKEVGSDQKVEREFTVKVWNDTVANLTLMALGSSAPEILLSVIEILSNQFYSGSLGPSTIVGSAAFNLFIILAVCIVSIPAAQSRTIFDLSVFIITATFSVVAYVWLYLMLAVISPDTVEVWEGAITLGMFPVLVVLAWMADTKKACFALTSRPLASKLLEVRGPDGQPLDAAQLLELSKLVRAEHGDELSPEENAELIAKAAHRMVRRSRAYRRVAATRMLSAGRKIRAAHQIAQSPRSTRKVAPESRLKDSMPEPSSTPVTKLPPIEKESLEDTRAATPAELLSADPAGMLAFKQDRIRVAEGCGKVVLSVIRKLGCEGGVSCKWKTRDGAAVAPNDYQSGEGELHFADGEKEKTIAVVINDDSQFELEEEFYVEIYEPQGARCDPTTDGWEDKCIAKVVIEDDDEATSSWLDKMLPFLAIDQDKLELGNAEYKEQFSQAFYVNGGDNEAEASASDWILHIFSVVWKVLFASVPPTRCCGGWLTFSVALIFIGLLTAVIGDLASLMGSAMGIEDSVTAITFVALGTSLPDTFASRTAAIQDAYADNAIGNVTGSNAVNVFLGLGLPWLIAAVYWSDVDEGEKLKWFAKYCGGAPSEVDSAISSCPDVGFAVPAGNLGASVGVFTGCAIVAIAVLMFRRVKYAAELGGPRTSALLTAGLFCTLWLIYISVSTYVAYN